jgi:hypothetical protein
MEIEAVKSMVDNIKTPRNTPKGHNASHWAAEIFERDEKKDGS